MLNTAYIHEDSDHVHAHGTYHMHGMVGHAMDAELCI